MANGEENMSTGERLKKRRQDLREQLIDTNRRSVELDKLFYLASGLAATFTALGVSLVAGEALASGIAFAAGGLFAAGAATIFNRNTGVKHKLEILQMDYESARDSHNDYHLSQLQSKERTKDNDRLIQEIQKLQSTQWRDAVQESAENKDNVVSIH